MQYFAYTLLSFVITSLILRILAAIGIGFYTYGKVTDLIDFAFAMIQTSVSTLPIQLMQLLALAGVPEALSVISSAIVANVTIGAAKVFVGVRR